MLPTECKVTLDFRILFVFVQVGNTGKINLLLVLWPVVQVSEAVPWWGQYFWWSCLVLLKWHFSFPIFHQSTLKTLRSCIPTIIWCICAASGTWAIHECLKEKIIYVTNFFNDTSDKSMCIVFSTLQIQFVISFS